MSNTIMVVDDEQDIRESIQMLLETKGYEVILAESGMDCLEKLKNIKPDLIISDFFMSKMSGRETIKKIREDTSFNDVKIIFLTVAEFQGEAFEKELNDLGISDYIQKPFDSGDFINRVEKILQ